MREIKFRAWIKEYKQMINKEQITSDGEDDNDAIMMQYIGLKDKNGRELYEGDIIKVHDYHLGNEYNNYEVKYDEEECVYKPFGNSEWSVKAYSHGVEIIGNIYENPDLLNNK